MPNITSETKRAMVFTGNLFWRLNIWGVGLAAVPVAVLMLSIAIVGLWPGHGGDKDLLMIFIGANGVIGLLYYFPGNKLAGYPHKIAIEDGKGLWLYAAFKKLYIPIEDLRDIRKPWYRPAYVVRLKKRHRWLGQFEIHWLFGRERRPLADAIEEQIRRANPMPHG
jgi:hypothetical protein